MFVYSLRFIIIFTKWILYFIVLVTVTIDGYDGSAVIYCPDVTGVKDKRWPVRSPWENKDMEKRKQLSRDEKL